MTRATPYLLLALVPLSARAQQKSIEYEISFPNRAQHEARVKAVFRGIPRQSTLEARMARSSPGRYASSSFAKNIYDVSATDMRPSGWRIATQLAPTADSTVFTAPNMQWFMDSPIEVMKEFRHNWLDSKAEKERRLQ
ncbi:MAG TPA: hypothetical protein VHM24_13280 [Gemmatimonadaceae bacterium]|nr:hypothetical protein [Gemmatimonadaceae bacterium]